MFGTQRLDASIKDGRTASTAWETSSGLSRRKSPNLQRVRQGYIRHLRFDKKVVRVDTNTRTGCGKLRIDEPHGITSGKTRFVIVLRIDLHRLGTGQMVPNEAWAATTEKQPLTVGAA